MFYFTRNCAVVMLCLFTFGELIFLLLIVRNVYNQLGGRVWYCSHAIYTVFPLKSDCPSSPPPYPHLPPGTTRSCWSRGQTRREGRQGTLTHPINSAAQTHRSSLREHGLRNKSSNSLRTGRIDLRPQCILSLP